MSAPRSWTPLELVQWTARYFVEHEIASPRLDAELLLAHVLGVKRIDLYLRFEDEVDTESRTRYRDLVRARGVDGVPVAYLTGRREFWSLDLRVTPDVLVPRPETEVLVRAVLDLEPTRVADIGTGSGAIAAAIAVERPECEVVAVERDPAALAIARENFAALGVAVTALEGDGVEPLEGAFDVIAANPPYVPTPDLGGLPREVNREPRAALDGGPDGLATIDQLVGTAPARLARPGALALEVGAGQAAEVERRLVAAGAGDVRVHKDLAGVERVVVGRF